MVACVQTMWSQGFRVYKSDGTVAQFSLRTDSIVFYEGIGTDVDFGPFTPVNQMIAGTWYKSKSEIITFGEDGTTDYMENATYKYMPYQGTIIIYNANGTPTSILKVHDVTSDKMIVSTLGSSSFNILTRTIPGQLVTSILLSDESFVIELEDTRIIIAEVLPEDVDNPDVIWESSDETIAQINNEGLVTAVACGTCTITCRAADSSGIYAECQVMVVNTHEFVDLGLPSGTLWATCNVGADNPEDYGYYFAWGETQPKETYKLNNYMYYNVSTDLMTKYCTDSSLGEVDNKTELESIDDAATANWGHNWKMPTDEQLEELVNENFTTIEWTVLNGVNGILITSQSNNNTIFLPAGGYYNGYYRDKGVVGHYWSSSLFENHWGSNGKGLYFYLEGLLCDFCSRECGRSVRPVRKQ